MSDLTTKETDRKTNGIEGEADHKETKDDLQPSNDSESEIDEIKTNDSEDHKEVVFKKEIKIDGDEGVVEAELVKRKEASESDRDNVYLDLNVNIHNEKMDYKHSKSSVFDVNGHDVNGDVEGARMSVASQTIDGNVISAGVEIIKKTLDANRYATKKTIAQGMLDIALLTANASQLKYILQVGHKHEFYTLMLSLIIVSIILQAVQGVLCVFLGSSLNINKQKEHNSANNLNNTCLAINVVTVIVNVIISAFDLKDPSELVTTAMTSTTMHM